MNPVLAFLRRRLVPVILITAGLVLVIVFRGPLLGWFSIGSGAGETGDAGAGLATPPADAALVPVLPAFELPPEALAAMRRGLDSYDRVREALAGDRLDGVAAAAADVAHAAHEVHAAAPGAPPALTAALVAAADAAQRVAAARDLDGARTDLVELSNHLAALAGADPRLQGGWNLYRCPMVPGEAVWLQHGTAKENPFMGSDMLTCGAPEPWPGTAPPPAVGAALSHAGHGHEGDDTAYFTCSMHPSVQRDRPGNCPVCGMKLSPVTFDELESGVVRIDPERRSHIGVVTGVVTRLPMKRSLRAVGRVTYDETAQTDVTLKVGGWITHLYVNATGQRVRAGQTLFTLYSPELYAAQQELLLARRSQSATSLPGLSGERGEALVRAATRKLRLWGLSQKQIDAIVARGEAREDVPFPSPASGFVIAKDVVEGAAIQPGQRLFRIAALDKVWVEAEVYESDLALVSAGQSATITLDYLPGKQFAGKVGFVYPYLDPATRTGRVRIELANPELELKPDMFATVGFEIDLGSRLQVPIESVIYTGPRRLVFVDLGDGRLQPREVTLGVRNEERVEIVAGLDEGQTIVVSGNFLVAAESRIRSAATLWAGDGAAAGGGGPAPMPSGHAHHGGAP